MKKYLISAFAAVLSIIVAAMTIIRRRTVAK